MDYHEEAVRTARHINLSDTEAFLTMLQSKRSFKVVSRFPTIDGINCEIKKDKRCFKFQNGPLNLTVSPVAYQSQHYGYGDPFELVNEHERILIPKGIGKMSLNFAEIFAGDGEFWEVESGFAKIPCYHRALIPINATAKTPVYFIESGSFFVGTSLRVKGYIDLTVSNKHIGVYDYKIADNEVLVIDCCSPVKAEEFQQIIDATVYSFALVSGSLLRNEVIILQSSLDSFESISGYQFTRLDDSINGVSTIEPRGVKEVLKTKDVPYLQQQIFSRMVQRCLDDARFFRAIKIIVESFGSPTEISTATHAVALETLKNIIMEENEEKINPFRKKDAASDLIKSLKKIVEELDISLFNNRPAVISRIENLNQVTNSDSFIRAFDLQGIVLTDDDIKCINLRNKFLHGEIPFQNERAFDDRELTRTVYKFHFLVTALIFKMVGFKGYLLNNVKMVDLLRYKTEDPTIPIFREI